MLMLNAVEERQERRSSRRYLVQEGAFAFINNTPFTIQNISEGGMMLQSVVFDDTPDEHLVLDIFLKSEDLYLKNIPVRLVSHSKSRSTTPFSAIQVRLYGLAFENLDEEQRILLDTLISKDAEGQA